MFQKDLLSLFIAQVAYCRPQLQSIVLLRIHSFSLIKLSFAFPLLVDTSQLHFQKCKHFQKSISNFQKRSENKCNHKRHVAIGIKILFGIIKQKCRCDFKKPNETSTLVLVFESFSSNPTFSFSLISAHVSVGVDFSTCI